MTTNTRSERVHPAVTRPGRCLAQIEVRPLSSREAAEWLGVEGDPWPNGASIAQLFAATDGRAVVAAGGDELSIGQYLQRPVPAAASTCNEP